MREGDLRKRNITAATAWSADSNNQNWIIIRKKKIMEKLSSKNILEFVSIICIIRFNKFPEGLLTLHWADATFLIHCNYSLSALYTQPSSNQFHRWRANSWKSHSLQPHNTFFSLRMLVSNTKATTEKSGCLLAEEGETPLYCTGEAAHRAKE